MLKQFHQREQINSKAKCSRCSKEVSVTFPMSILQGYLKCDCFPGHPNSMLLTFVSPADLKENPHDHPGGRIPQTSYLTHT